MSPPSAHVDVTVRIGELLTSFKLPTMAAELVPRFTAAGHSDVLPLVAEVLELEAGDRRERRVDRLRRASRLPPGKTFATLDEARLPRPLVQQLREIARGEFLESAGNVLAFGLPERDLELPRALRHLDVFDLVVLDDIGYVQQTPDEIEVLFTFLAERYERRSVLITSNLVFSEWDRIFKNPMTTAAAIDRLVRHSVILEFAVPSYRSENAKSGKNDKSEPNKDNHSKSQKAKAK